MNEAEGMDLLKKCLHESKRRFIVNLPSFEVRISTFQICNKLKFRSKLSFKYRENPAAFEWNKKKTFFYHFSSPVLNQIISFY